MPQSKNLRYPARSQKSHISAKDTKKVAETIEEIAQTGKAIGILRRGLIGSSIREGVNTISFGHNSAVRLLQFLDLTVLMIPIDTREHTTERIENLRKTPPPSTQDFSFSFSTS